MFGVASFYAHFALEPKGKYIIKICDGTACHVRHSKKVIDAVHNRLELSEKKNTTDDLTFTVEVVSCLGACGLAPLVVVNEEVYPTVTPDSMVKVIDNIIKKEVQSE